MLQLARSAFVEGYAVALRQARDAPAKNILSTLSAMSPPHRPFAFEGAGKALRMRQERPPWRPWVEEVLDIADERWHLFLRLGVGCAEARLGVPPAADPQVQDGYGFQLGLLSGASGRTHTDLVPVAHGLGRAAWFTSGGRGQTCAALLTGKALISHRWRGIGVACVFAGDPMNQASSLPRIAGRYAADIRQGGRTALELWQRLGCEVPSRVWSAVRSLERVGDGA